MHLKSDYCTVPTVYSRAGFECSALMGFRHFEVGLLYKPGESGIYDDPCHGSCDDHVSAMRYVAAQGEARSAAADANAWCAAANTAIIFSMVYSSRQCILNY